MNDAILARVLGVAAALGGALRIAAAFAPWAPGQAWLERVTRTYPACVWLNPVPEKE